MDLLDDVLQEELERAEEEDETEEAERNGKRLRVEEGELSEQEEKEQQEAKKIRIDEGEISDEGLSRALRSSSSSSLSSIELEAEVETALSPSERSDTIIVNNSNVERHNTDSRPIPKRIETGIFSHIPTELLYHILKFLSSEVSRLYSFMFVCRCYFKLLVIH